MQKLQFNVNINASREKVWKVLWDDASYRKWTSAFMEGSYALSSWKEGSRVHFLSPNGDGMFSEISKMTPNEYMEFRHLGEMKNGKEQPPTAETEKWAGAMETYRLREHGDMTELTASVDIIDDHADFFREAFPKALAIVKQLSEAS
jgi:hypothetical protein